MCAAILYQLCKCVICARLRIRPSAAASFKAGDEVKIPTGCVFAYATEGAALEVANKTIEETRVLACFIQGSDRPAKRAVCYIVVPVSRPLVKV